MRHGGAATPPLSEAELKVQQRGVLIAAAMAVVVCASGLTLAYVCLPRFLEFPNGLAERMAFALQADVFVLLWIVFGVRQVAHVRFRSASDNRGSAYGPPSPRLAIPVAFLQNTLEQAVAAVGAHLALSTMVTGNALALIVGAVALFGLGRICFLAGYPKGARGRAFGVVLAVLPTLAAYGFVLILVGRTVMGSLLL